MNDDNQQARRSIRWRRTVRTAIGVNVVLSVALAAVVLAMVIAGAVTIRRALADPKPSARESLEGTYA